MIKDTKYTSYKMEYKTKSNGLVYMLVLLYIHIIKNIKHVSAHWALAVACSFFCQLNLVDLLLYPSVQQVGDLHLSCCRRVLLLQKAILMPISLSLGLNFIMVG